MRRLALIALLALCTAACRDEVRLTFKVATADAGLSVTTSTAAR